MDAAEEGQKCPMCDGMMHKSEEMPAHDETAMQNGIPKLTNLRPFVLTGEMIEQLAVPSGVTPETAGQPRLGALY